MTQQERDLVRVENGMISVPVDYWKRINLYVANCEKCFEFLLDKNNL